MYWTCLLAILASCGSRSLRPIDIDATDVCARCKMAMSEKWYAAEMIDGDGNVRKFDNVDCMIRYAAANGIEDKSAVFFVMDSEGRKWLNARKAFLVKSVSIPGPMGDGILATDDSALAGSLARRFAGRILRLDELWR
jgi:copper chaperone NosL